MRLLTGRRILARMSKNRYFKHFKETTDYFAIGFECSRIEKSRGQPWLETNFSILEHSNRFAKASNI
jgi:hypothetical protein